MRNSLATRFWIELLLGIISAALCALAVFAPEWIEMLSGATPDGGDGSAEKGFAILWASTSLLAFGLARQHWRRHIQQAS
jgi:hypothetical protein